MHSFVKQAKVESNRPTGAGKISITNEVLIDDSKAVSLARDTEDWKDLRYKLVRSRWKKMHIIQDKPAIPIQIDQVLKEPPKYMLTARPKYYDPQEQEPKHQHSDERKVELKPSPAENLTRHLKEKTKRDHISKIQKPARNDRMKAASPAEVKIVEGLKPDEPSLQTASAKLKSQVKRVMNIFKLQKVNQDKSSHASEKSNANAVVSPERNEKLSIGARQHSRMLRRLSSGSSRSHKSKRSSFGDVGAEARRSSKLVAEEESKKDMTSSESQSESSGIADQTEGVPKVIVLHNTDRNTIAPLDPHRQTSKPSMRRSAAVIEDIRNRRTRVSILAGINSDQDYRYVSFVYPVGH